MSQSTLTLYRTTIGKKVAMAASGTILLGFVVVHMIGNLQLYLGPETINGYAASLRAVPALLWSGRILLLIALVVHVIAMIQLANRNSNARPYYMDNKKKHDIASTYASRTMYWTGPVLLFYIVYHVLHLTLGQSGGQPFAPGNVYDNVVYGFRVWWISAVYIAGNLALVVHLYHGTWSLFQTVGANHPRYNAWRRRFASAVAAIITLGNLSFPISVLAGWVKPSAELTETNDVQLQIQAPPA